MYAVIGASGYLGSYFLEYILANTDEGILATSRYVDSLSQNRSNDRVIWINCDVRSDASVDEVLNELRCYSAVKIIYLAAYHHPEEAELHKKLAWDINVTALSKFVNKADFIDSFYYVSTDSVYGDSINGYHFCENDPLNPVNFYGHCKCAAEAITLHLGRNVVRLPFLISPGLAGKKHFYDKIVDDMRQGKTVEMFSDSFRSTLGFDQAAKLVVELAERNKEHQIVNVCGDKDLSKYDVGITIAKREGLDPDLIVPLSANKSKEWNKVRRAHSTLMDNSLLKSILGIDKISLYEDILLTKGEKEMRQ